MMIVNELSRAVEQLLGRASGPFHIRLLLQPAIATIFAIRAGLRDARNNNPAFLWEFVKNLKQRKALLKTLWQDIGKLIITAFVIDSCYQIIVLKSFFLLQALIVTFILALFPYILFRGPITRLLQRYGGY